MGQFCHREFGLRFGVEDDKNHNACLKINKHDTRRLLLVNTEWKVLQRKDVVVRPNPRPKVIVTHVVEVALRQTPITSLYQLTTSIARFVLKWSQNQFVCDAIIYYVESALKDW